MKYNIFAIVIIAGILAACAEGPKAGTALDTKNYGRSPTAVANLELKKEDLWSFEGYWRRTGTGEPNVVSVIGEYKDEDQGIVTEVKGIDLYKDFAYRSLPYAVDDTVVMKLNPDRKVIEALLRKNMGGEPSLFEMVFSQPTVDSLRIEIRLNGKLAVHEFARISDEEEGLAQLRAIHNRLLRQELRAHTDGTARFSCENPDNLVSSIRARDLKCMKAIIKAGASIKTAGLLLEAVKSVDPEIVEYLIQNRVVLDPLALNEASEGGSFSIGFAQHGLTDTYPLKKYIQKILIQAGVDFNHRQYDNSSTAFGQILSYGGDAEALEMMFDRGADPKCDCADGRKKAYTTFTINFEERWGKKGPALLERLLKTGIDMNAQMGMFLNFAVREVNVEALQKLGAQGADLKTPDRISLLKFELEGARKSLTDPIFSPYLQQQRLRRKIKRLEENFAYLTR